MPGAKRRRPGAERRRPGAERCRPGAERHRPGAKRHRPGAERCRPGAERCRPGTERCTSSPEHSRSRSGPFRSKGPEPGGRRTTMPRRMQTHLSKLRGDDSARCFKAHPMDVKGTFGAQSAIRAVAKQRSRTKMHCSARSAETATWSTVLQSPLAPGPMLLHGRLSRILGPFHRISQGSTAWRFAGSSFSPLGRHWSCS